MCKKNILQKCCWAISMSNMRSICLKVIVIGQVEPPTKFLKGGGELDRTSIFRGGLLGK